MCLFFVSGLDMAGIRDFTNSPERKIWLALREEIESSFYQAEGDCYFKMRGDQDFSRVENVKVRRGGGMKFVIAHESGNGERRELDDEEILKATGGDHGSFAKAFAKATGMSIREAYESIGCVFAEPPEPEIIAGTEDGLPPNWGMFG